MKRYIRSSKDSKGFTVECYLHHGEDPVRNRFDSYRSAIRFAIDSVKSTKYEDVIITSPGVNGPSVVNSWSKQDGWYKDPSITSAKESYQLYRNNRNENKYIEVRKTTDGHTEYRSFMFWNTDRGPVKNYYTSKSNKGRWHRGTKDSIKKMLEDYQMVESVEDDVKNDFSYAGSPENPNDIVSKTLFARGVGKIFASCIGNYKGYEVCQENDHDQRFYFLDDKKRLHFADLEEELKAQIDDYIEKKDQKIEAATYVQKLIRKRPKKDRNGEPLVYSGSGGRSLVGINYSSIDKFDSKEAAIENLKKYAKNLDEWEVVELEDVDNVESCDTIQSSIDVDNFNKGDIIVVNNESKLSNKLDLVAVAFDHYSKDDDRTFWGWAWNEHLFRYYKSTIVYHAKSMDDAEKFISKNKKKSVEDFNNITSSEDISLHNLDDQLILFLEDLVFTHHILEDLDFSYSQVTDEEEKQLFKYMNQYMAAEDDGDKTRSEYIANRVKDFIVSINSVVEASQSASGWYVGDPDPTGRLEGDIRFENKIHSWRDAYQEFNKIADKYFPDAEKIDEEIAKLYFRHSKNPFFQQAWMRWRDSGEDDIEASDEGLSPFIVYFTYDSGDAENGPIIQGGDDLMYAEDVDDAVDKWCDMFVDPDDTTFCGAWAEPADEEYIARWKKHNE